MKTVLFSISFLITFLNCSAQGTTQEKSSNLTKCNKSQSETGYIGNSENGLFINNSIYNEIISYSLANRRGNILADPIFNSQEEGIVVVLIRVNQEGNIVNAQVRLKGTNTNSSALFKAAVKAAMLSTFNKDMNAAKEQKGTITYRFCLKK